MHSITQRLHTIDKCSDKGEGSLIVKPQKNMAPAVKTISTSLVYTCINMYVKFMLALTLSITKPQSITVGNFTY